MAERQRHDGQQREQRHRERDLEYGEAGARQLDQRIAGREAGVAQNGEPDAARGDAATGDRHLQGRHRGTFGQVR